MVEHVPWTGRNYRTLGIENQRLAIVGYSHWGDDEDYGDEGSRNCIEKVISGEWKIRFFTSIRNYFGFDHHSDFWHRVVFFNFLPECIGDGDARFNRGTEQQTNRASARLLSIIEKKRPHKLLIFTRKGWESCPATREEVERNAPPAMLGPEFPTFSWGTYETGGQITTAFGLRHPQGASGELMKRAVRHILNLPPV